MLSFGESPFNMFFSSLFIITFLSLHCRSDKDVINFDGQSFVIMKLVNRPISSRQDIISLEFRTNNANGNLIHSEGIQRDFFTLQLHQNKLVLTLDLGGDGQINSISSGSLLDDNLWHHVLINRTERDLVFSIDNNVVKQQLTGHFIRLDLNDKLYIGGLSSSIQSRTPNNRHNFTGCIRNLFLNNTNIISELKAEAYKDSYVRFGSTVFTCKVDDVTPITFLTSGSHIIFDVSIYNFVNVSLDFRTFNNEGLIWGNKFTPQKAVLVYLEQGKIFVRLLDENEQSLLINPFPTENFDDGRWHRLIVSLETNLIKIIADEQVSVTKRLISPTSGTQFKIGGGFYNKVGFIGCIRWLSIQNQQMLLRSISPERIRESTPKEVIIGGSCEMIDRCHPNPCEHGGICRQDNLNFNCDCTNTGYTGAICHMPGNPLSCEAYIIEQPSERLESDHDYDTVIDVDGSGPLEPFPVTCKFSRNSGTQTILHHKNEGPVRVVGYQEPGSYQQDLKYDADFVRIGILVNKSYFCKQYLKLDCYNARLFNTPYQFSEFKPNTWWLSRNNQKMKYWGGSLPQSRKCNCGLYGNCQETDKWCNCDATKDVNSWKSDGGDILDKDYLPIRSIKVGDTGITQTSNKEVRYTVGPLICEGDSLSENVVTFRLPDGMIPLPLIEFGLSADIYFQFKTTVESGVLVHLKGPSDFIKLSLAGPKTMQLTFDVGYGSNSLQVDTGNLNNDKWHTVSFEWNRKEVKLVVDGKASKMLENRLGGTRPLNLSSNFVIGALAEEGEGFVGCMRAFSVNGQFVDLVKLARTGDYGRPLFGVGEGCVGKCASHPCFNNGTCQDYYSNYECDCQWTAFKGRICADEVGVSLASENYIVYDLETVISTIEERIRVGFTTTEHKGLIIGISSQSGEYLNLVMSTSGNLRLIFDFGFERQELIIKNENFALGQHHDVSISRSNKGSVMTIIVDNYEPIVYTFKIAEKADAQFNLINRIYIGRNNSMGSGDGFVGCISRVSFEDHFPLKRLFQSVTPPNIKAYPSFESIREDNCGIESVTHPPAEIETRAPPLFQKGTDKDSSSSFSAGLMGSLITIIIIIIIIVALIFNRRLITHQKGDYVTHEDKGARDALDPDTAVVKGKTCPDITKRKEYFI